MESGSVRDSKITETLQNNIIFQSVNNSTPTQCKYVSVKVNVPLSAHFRRGRFTVIREKISEYYCSFFAYLTTLSLLKTERRWW